MLTDPHANLIGCSKVTSPSTRHPWMLFGIFGFPVSLKTIKSKVKLDLRVSCWFESLTLVNIGKNVYVGRFVRTGKAL